MKCQKCGLNHANINYTRVVNGERMELHLCDACAQKMNLHMNTRIGFDDIFSHFFDEFSEVGSLAMPGLISLRDFNHDFDGLMNTSLFNEIPFFKNDFFFDGDRLVEDSNNELDQVLSNIQKKHQAEKNKVERKNISSQNREEEMKKEHKVTDKKQEEILKLKEKMQEYIQKEEYEKAAVLRDQIKKLES